MTTVYVVTSGEYSDYGIQGVFSTRGAADEYVRQFNQADNIDPARVEEYPLDGLADAVARPYWRACLSVETGEPFPYDIAGGLTTGVGLARPEQRSDEVEVHPGLCAVFATSYVSADHARKLAAERRQAVLRLRARVGG